MPVQRGGMAAGAVNTARQLGFAFGIAVLGSVFSLRAQSVLRDRGVAHAASVAKEVAGGQTGALLAHAPLAARAQLDHALHAGAVAGLQWSFLVAGLVGIAAGLAVLILVRPNAPAAQTPTEHAVAAAH